MTGQLTLALAQLNPVVGNVAGNARRLLAARAEAAHKGAHLLITPELFLSGYPPEDLVLNAAFQKTLHETMLELAAATKDGGAAMLLGTPWVEDNELYNAALLLEGGAVAAKIFKRDLPNYGPFDEKRVFAAGGIQAPMMFRGHRLGVMICEDMWTPTAAADLRNAGADILIVPNGSPYETGKPEQRLHLAQQRVQETELPLVYVNQIGGQDELVFDGASFVLDAAGGCVACGAAWREDVSCVDFSGVKVVSALTSPPFIPPPVSGHGAGSSGGEVFAAKTEQEEIYSALMLGLRDYVQKNQFPGVVLGLSGGIDSALVAALAVDALGADKVWCVMMPSPYTSHESLDDAAALAQKLGCRYDILSIGNNMEAANQALAPLFANKQPDTTEENIQARLRGMMLMALSNKFGAMVLSTGNKSEMSVGYSTLYGDLCGGFAVIKDVYKTQVYALSRWRNAHKPANALGPAGAIIPDAILTKAPTAELRPNQKDQDSLPPYDELDAILYRLVEQDDGIGAVAADGFDAATVKRVAAMLARAEYKRRQAPPGVKISPRHLNKDRRYPITNGYRE